MAESAREVLSRVFTPQYFRNYVISLRSSKMYQIGG